MTSVSSRDSTSPPHRDNSFIALLIRSSCVFYSSFIVVLVIRGLLPNHQDRSPEYIELYGLDKVSGFYGPGSWAAWLFTLVSCCFDRLVPSAKKGPPHTEGLHVLSIDLELVAAFGYPLIASFDLILRLYSHHRDETSTNHIACMAAAHTVAKMGTGLNFMLAFICFFSWLGGSSRFWSVVFGAFSTLFMLCTIMVFDVIYFGFEYHQLIASLFLSPGFGRGNDLWEETRLHLLARNSDLFSTWQMVGYLGYYLWSMSPWTALFGFPLSLSAGFLAVSIPSCGIAWGFKPELVFLQVVVTIHLTIWACMIFWSYIVSFFLFEIWFANGIPLSMASILDLDQLSVFLISGALVVANTWLRIFLENKELLAGGLILSFELVQSGTRSCMTWLREQWSPLTHQDSTNGGF
jgi:hypothetical protein